MKEPKYKLKDFVRVGFYNPDKPEKVRDTIDSEDYLLITFNTSGCFRLPNNDNKIIQIYAIKQTKEICVGEYEDECIWETIKYFDRDNEDEFSEEQIIEKIV
jgi:hypothetical protein